MICYCYWLVSGYFSVELFRWILVWCCFYLTFVSCLLLFAVYFRFVGFCWFVCDCVCGCWLGLALVLEWCVFDLFYCGFWF